MRGSSLGQSLTQIRSRPHLSHTSVRAHPRAMSFMRDTSREVEQKALREFRKNNSKRGNGAPSTVDGTSQFRNLDEVPREVIATVHRGGENARVHERSSEIQAGTKQTRLDNNSPDGSRNPRESAVPLGGAGAHHQGPMHDDQAGARGGPRGVGAATGKDVGCAYRTAAAEETYKGLLEVGVSGSKANAMLSPQRNGDVRAMELAVFARSRDADTSTWGHPSTWPKDKIGRLSLKDFNRWTKAQQKDVQGPATPVAKATVHPAPVDDASKALEEDGSDHIEEGVAEGEEDFVHQYDAISETESITPTEEREPELRSVPSGPPTSGGKLPTSVELCDGCKTQLENLKRSKDPRDTLQSFKPCHTCLSAAIRVCPPCQADIHDDGSRDNGGHGKVNYDMLKNKTPESAKLQIQRHRMTDGALVCKQCYTQLGKLDKKRKRDGLPPRTPKAVADAPNEMSAGTRARSFSSVSLEHNHLPGEKREDCPACMQGCGALLEPMTMSEVEQDRLRLLNKVDDLEYSHRCLLDRVAELERRAGIRRPGVSTYTRQVFTNRPSV